MRSLLPPVTFVLSLGVLAILPAAPARADDDDKGFDERKATRLRFILEEGPDAGPIFDKLYAMYKKAGRLSKLIADYKKRVEAGEKEVAPYYILGRLYERERELRVAAKTYRAGLKEAKGLRLERFFQYRLGIVFADLRRFKEAADALLAAEKLAREPDLKSSVLEELGRVYMRTGRRDEGSAAWRRILEIRRRDFFATIHVATLMAKEKLFSEVDTVFREAIAGPFANDPAAALKLRAKQGEILEAAARYEDAAKAYRTVLARTKSGNWLKRQVKARLRRMYLQIGRAYALIDFYKKSMDERPNDEEPVLDLADAYELMGSQGLARRLLLDRRARLPGSVLLRERLIHLLGGPILYTRQTTILPIAESKKERVGEDEGDPLAEEGSDPKKPAKEAKKKKESKEDAEEKRLAQVLEELFFDPSEWIESRCQLLEELIALRPAESKYYKALATEHLKAERTAEAEEVMARLQKLRAGIEGLLQSAEAYRASGRLDEALEALARAARMAPGDERPFILRGEVFLQMRDKPAALAAFARAAGSEDGRSAELGAFAQRRLSTLLEEHKLLLESAWAMSRAIKADLDIASRDDLMRAGKLFQRADKPLIAGRWYLKSFEASQDSNERKLTLTLLRETLTDAAQLAWLSRVLKQRCRDLERADPQVVLALAGVTLDQGRPAEAVKLLEEAAGGPPKVRFASEDVFKEVDEGAPVKAKPAEEARELGAELPPRVLYLRQLVDLYSGVKGARPDILKAFAALQELARLDRANRWRYALTEGLAQLRRGYREEAKAIFRRVLSIAPANADVFVDLARHFEELKDYPAALEAARKAVDQTPRDGRRHWAHIELIRRHLQGHEAEDAHLAALRRFVQSGVNSQDLETARDDLYGLLMRRAESLAAREHLEEAIRCSDEARSLAAADEPRARAQLLGAALQLKSSDPLPALEILQGVVGRFRSSWVVLDRTRVPAAHLAASWLRRLEGPALEAYKESLAPRGRELFEVARQQEDRPLLGRLGRIFPFDPAARARLAQHIEALVDRGRYEEALWNLDRLASTAPGDASDPHASEARAWRETCERELGEAPLPALPAYSSRPARTLRIDGGLNTGALAAPVIYGERLFYALPGGELRCLLLDRLATPRQRLGAQAPSPLAARYKLGRNTPKSRVIYQLGQPNSYYYYQNGVLGVASLPESSAGPSRQEDAARAWRRSLGSVTGLAAAGGRLFVAGRGVQALSPRTGHTLWRYGDPRDRAENPEAPRKSAPPSNGLNVATAPGAPGARAARTMVDLVVSRERIYALAVDGVVAALDPATGEALWSAEGFGTFGDGALMLRGQGPESRLYVARDDRVSCLSARTGKRLWRSDSITAAALRKNESRKRAQGKKTPVKAGKTRTAVRRVVTSGMNGAQNFRINMGNPRNKLVYKPSSGPSGQRPAPELMFSGDFLAASNRLGGVVVIKLDDGAITAARHFDNEPHLALIGERLWVAERQNLTVIDGAKDTEGPKQDLKQQAMGPPILVDEKVLIPTTAELLTLDQSDARILVREPLDRLEELPAKPAKRSRSRSRRSSQPPQTSAPASMTVRRLAGTIALRGNRFLLLDPKTGKRRFEFALGARSNQAQARRSYRYGRTPPPDPREPFASIASRRALCVTDNSGALHIFLARE